jgi:hypothetical protein
MWEGVAEVMWNRRRGNKYGAIKVKIDGYTFDSKAEARRYKDLKVLPGKDIEVHPRFPIFIQGIKVCDVVLDFKYTMTSGTYYEDVKGHDTALSRLKRKMVEAAYGIKVEVLRR